MGSRDASPPGTKRQVIEGCPMRGSRKKQVTRYSNRGSKPVEVSPLGDIGPLESATTVPTGWSKAEGACKSWHSPKKRQKEEKKEN